MVITRMLEEQRPPRGFTELVFGVLIFLDLTAIVVITTLAAIATGSGASIGVLGGTLFELGLFLTGSVLVAVPVIALVARRGVEEARQQMEMRAKNARRSNPHRE